MAELCTAYWYPIYALVRRLGNSETDALDLTQDYFARLMEKPVLAAADRSRGRFRAFLRADCGFFLKDHRDRGHALRSVADAGRRCRSTLAMPRGATSSSQSTT